MLSYWFVCYLLRYMSRDGNFCEIRGNSVHELSSNSFLPGTVRTVIEREHLKKLSTKLPEGYEIAVTIESFGAIDQEGFNNFNNGGSGVNSVFSLYGREFIHKNTVTTIISRA